MPEHKETVKEAPVPVIRVAVNAQVDGGRNPKQMSLETYVPQDISVSDFNKVADTLREVLERQTAAYEIVNVEDAIDRAINDITMVRDQIAKVDERHRQRELEGPLNGKRAVKIPDNELANRQVLIDRVAQGLAQVDSHKQLLNKLRAKVDSNGGVSVGSTTDSAGM